MGATAALMAQGLGTGWGAIAQARAGAARKRQADYNAGQLDLQAQDATRRGTSDASRIEVGAGGIVGAQRAGLAASGVDVGAGSPLDAVRDTYRTSEADALQTRINAANESWGIRAQAADLRNSGDIAAAEGRNAAVGTLLGGAADMALRRWGFKAQNSGAVMPNPVKAIPGLIRKAGAAVGIGPTSRRSINKKRGINDLSGTGGVSLPGLPGGGY